MSTDDSRRLADRYVLDTPIGRGGMGEVWRATDTVLGRQVAVKTIDLRRVPDESGAARFEREAKVTAGMSHPNIVTVHDTGVEGDTAYLVMELLPGPSLAARIAEGPLPVEEVVEVGRQVASALDAAHRRGLVHRDIKPANLVYAADGRVRVVDFGITQLGEAGPEQALTATHTVMGTAEYLAPEQATGGRVDGRADLYALGCVLFALLAGEAPFRGATPVATMMMHANDPVPDLQALRPDAPAWLVAVVVGLLAKDPADRPESAASLVTALESRQAPEGAVGAAGAAGAAATTTVLPASGADPTQRLAATPTPTPTPTPPPPASPVPPPPPPARDRGGSSAAMWVLAVVALLALALVAWQVFGGDDTGGDAPPTATPTASSQEPAPSTSEPEPTPTTSEPTEAPTEEAPDPAPVADARQSLGDEVSALRQEGAIDNDGAKAVEDPLKDVDKALREDDPEKLVEARDSLLEDYREAVEEGTIPAEASQRLDPLVQGFSDAVDTYVGG